MKQSFKIDEVLELNKWNGNNMRNVNRIILVLEDLENIFKGIRDKQYSKG